MSPTDWPDLEAFLADLAVSLGSLAHLRTHPVGQSVRHGSQTSQRLTLSDDPAIRAFFAAKDEPLGRYNAALGPGDDPLRSRVTGGYKFNGEWSVRLREGGYHADTCTHAAGCRRPSMSCCLGPWIANGKDG